MSEMPVSDRNRSNLPCVARFTSITPSSCLPCRWCRRHVGAIHNAAAALNVASDIAGAREKALFQRRQRRYFVRIQRTDQLWRNQHQQLRLLRALRLRLEQMTDDRQARQARDFLQVVLRQIVEQPRHREGLAVAQFDIRFAAAGCQRGNTETRQQNAVREVERADLRSYMEPNGVSRNRWREVEPNAVLLIRDADGVAATTLNGRDGNFAARKKARFLAVVGNQ